MSTQPFDASNPEVAKLKARLDAAEAERDRYKREVTDYEEREAACCPEDFGFDEVIASLRKRLAAAEARVVKAETLLREAADAMSDDGYVVLPERIEAFLASRPEGEVRDGR